MADSLASIRNEFDRGGDIELSRLIEKYSSDKRSGVQALVHRAMRRQAYILSEREKLEKMRVFEHQYEAQGLVCGIDEAGRGPLAGPVVAGAVILPENCEILGLNDSKQLTEKKREELYDEIQYKAIAVGVGIIGPKRIDEINILQADYEAMREAIRLLADARSVSIAAASVIAKVTRDRMMTDLDRMYPGYGFAKNKGYGTAGHIAALKKMGPCDIHRRTFITHFV